MKKLYRPTSGHILDIDSSEIAEQFLSLASNVHMRKGFPSRRGGRRIAYPVSAGAAPTDPYHLLNFSLNSFNWWMVFGTNKIYGVEGANSYDITLAGMQTIIQPSEWASTLLNGIPVFTNGKDIAMYWDGLGTSDALGLPGWPVGTACKFITAFRFHLFAFNIDGPGGEFQDMVMWSDPAGPGTLPTNWTAGVGNEAGSFNLAETTGRAICGVALGSQLLMYKPTSVYAAEYVGQQPDNIFSQRCINRSLGALGPRCVIELGTKHLVVGNDDVVLQDTVNAQSIAENRIKNFLSNSIDETNAQNTFVLRDLNKREVWICVPESGSQFATIAHVWDERRDCWMTRDLASARYGTTGYVTDSTPSSTWDADGATWDSDLTSWDESSVGSISRVMFAQPTYTYVEDTPDATTYTATLARYDLAFDDPSVSKLLQRITVHGTGDGLSSIQVRCGGRDKTTDAIVWSGFVSVDDAETLEISAHYISFELQLVTSDDWTINKIVVEARTNGKY